MGLEKVRLSSWEALVRLVSGSPCRTVSLDERGLEKRRLSGRECSRRRPSGYRGLLSGQVLDGRVKLSGRKASQSTGSVVG